MSTKQEVKAISSTDLGFPAGTSIASAADGNEIDCRGRSRVRFFFDFDYTTASEVTWKLSIKEHGSSTWRPYTVAVNEGSGSIRYYDYTGKRTTGGADDEWCVTLDLGCVDAFRLEDVTGSTSDTIEIAAELMD